jgi:acetyl-CoA synthetase
VEAAAVSHPAVREAAAVGLPDAVKGTRLVLVAVPNGDVAPPDSVSNEVAAHVGARMGPTMRPSEVRWVPSLPVTRSGKILRGVIRRVLAGEDPGNLASVANPESLEALRHR